MTQTTPTLWRVQYRTATDSGTQAEGLTFAEADEIARDLTRLEIEQHQGDQVTEYFLVPYQADQTRANQKITDSERQRRVDTVNAARASVRLEGFILDDATEQLNNRYINGEITSEELTQEILKLSGLS